MKIKTTVNEYLTHVGIAVIQKTEEQDLVRLWLKKRKPLCSVGEIIMGNRMEVPQKIKNRTTCDPTIPLWYKSRGNKISILMRYSHFHVHCSTIYNNQNMETVYLSEVEVQALAKRNRTLCWLVSLPGSVHPARRLGPLSSAKAWRGGGSQLAVPRAPDPAQPSSLRKSGAQDSASPQMVYLNWREFTGSTGVSVANVNQVNTQLSTTAAP